MNSDSTFYFQAGRFLQIPQYTQMMDARMIDPNLQNPVYQNMGQYAVSFVKTGLNRLKSAKNFWLERFSN